MEVVGRSGRLKKMNGWDGGLTSCPSQLVCPLDNLSPSSLKRAIELGEHEINYSLHTAVKGQILADYLAETTGEVEALVESTTIGFNENQVWELYTDGACGPKGAGVGLVLTSPDGEEHTYALRFRFAATNNEFEYEALLSGMCIAQQLGIKHLDAYVDPQLVQRWQKKKVDALRKLSALAFDLLHKNVWVEVLIEKSIDEKSTVAPIEEESLNWMTPLVKLLTEGKLPADEKEARKIRMKAPMYALIEGVLYKKSYLETSMLCIAPNQAKEVLQEVHEGSCALHLGYITIAAKVMRIGYYWTTIHSDAAKIVRTCQSHQRNHIIIACSGGIKFLVVAIDYFTKWVEAKALATITSRSIRNFFWEDIVCRFGIPNEIFSENGTQFEGEPFRSWCQELNIKQSFTSVAHPQANGQCEVTNRDIVKGIKARLAYMEMGGLMSS
ncbi:uncharacterized protein [Rutidosis leptorrhynchoides]|uniref:uncharacterized protein n=1 Tax=Rutidosis leptorrhynchoides TaxID=125765 RepID=UPI003A99AC9B